MNTSGSEPDVELGRLTEDDLTMMEQLTQEPASTGEFGWFGWSAHRIEAATEVGNVAEQRALEKAGFTREGITRGIGWRSGAWRDGVTYSLLRTDATAPV